MLETWEALMVNDAFRLATFVVLCVLALLQSGRME